MQLKQKSKVVRIQSATHNTTKKVLKSPLIAFGSKLSIHQVTNQILPKQPQKKQESLNVFLKNIKNIYLDQKSQIQTRIQSAAQPSSQIFDKNINISQFKLKQPLGQGSYAIVYEAQDIENNQQYAIKQYPLEKLNQQQQLTIKREILSLRSITHPKIIKIIYAIKDQKNISIVMENPNSQNLKQYLKENLKISFQNNIKIFKQIAQAIQYCHEKDICHRDIKTDNILIDQEFQVKLIDFGFSVFCNDSKKLNIFCGTPKYMCPQIVNKVNYSGKKADVWSLGVLLYVLLYQKYPFQGYQVIFRFQ